MLSEADNILLTRTGRANADGRVVSPLLAAGAAQCRTTGTRRRPGPRHDPRRGPASVPCHRWLGRSGVPALPASRRRPVLWPQRRRRHPLRLSRLEVCHRRALPRDADDGPRAGARAGRAKHPAAGLSDPRGRRLHLGLPRPARTHAGTAGTRVPDAAAHPTCSCPRSCNNATGRRPAKAASTPRIFPFCTWRCPTPPTSPRG